MRVPKYRKHSNGIGFVEYAGKRRYFKGKYGSAESRREYALFIASLEEDSPMIRGDVRVRDLVERYLDYARGYYGGNREYDAFCAVARPLLYLHESTRVEDFGPRALKAVRSLMISGEWTDPPRPWVRTNINHQVNRIRRIFRWGVAEEIVPPDVLHALEALDPLKKGRTTAKESPKIKPVNLRHVRETARHATSPQVAAMIELQAITGMRSDNLCSMRPGDIDRSGEVWLYTPETHKGAWREGDEEEEPTLVIPLGPKAQAVLEPFLRRRGKKRYLFSPAEAEAHRRAQRASERQSKRTPSQRNRTPKKNPKRAPGERYDSYSYRRAVKYAQKKANAARKKRKRPPLPSWHPHQLRHTVATRIRRSHGIEGSQVYLGHAHADVTQVYAERDLRLAVSIARAEG